MTNKFFAVAIMIEKVEHGGIMDMELSLIRASSRYEAVGIVMEKHQGSMGIVIHKVTAMEIFDTANENSVYLNLLSEGKKIAAIKKYREDTGKGLQESKAFIDELKLRYIDGIGK